MSLIWSPLSLAKALSTLPLKLVFSTFTRILVPCSMITSSSCRQHLLYARQGGRVTCSEYSYWLGMSSRGTTISTGPSLAQRHSGWHWYTTQSMMSRSLSTNVMPSNCTCHSSNSLPYLVADDAVLVHGGLLGAEVGELLGDLDHVAHLVEVLALQLLLDLLQDEALVVEAVHVVRVHLQRGLQPSRHVKHIKHFKYWTMKPVRSHTYDTPSQQLAFAATPALFASLLADSRILLNHSAALHSPHPHPMHIKLAHPLSLHSHYLYFFHAQGFSIYDLHHQALLSDLTTETAFTGDVALSDDILTAHNKVLLLWDLRTRKPVNCIMAHSMQITSALFSANSHYITTSAMDNYARVFAAGMSECLCSISKSKFHHTTHSQFTRDGKFVLVSTLHNPLSLWDWSKCQEVQEYGDDVWNERFYLQPEIVYKDSLPDRILMGNDDGGISVLDFANKKKAYKLDVEGNRVVVVGSKMYVWHVSKAQVDEYEMTE